MKPSDYQAEKAVGLAAVPAASGLTPPDILGPFYRPGAPLRTKLVDNPALTLAGHVRDQSGNPVGANSLIEFWQADADGKYDENGPGFRGIQQIVGGTYHLETVRPGHYDISDPADPPPHEFRCSHIHVKVWVNGKDVLTTQLYFPPPDAPLNKADHWFDARRMVTYAGSSPANAKFDFVVKTK